jgi:hypothetical protein
MQTQSPLDHPEWCVCGHEGCPGQPLFLARDAKGSLLSDMVVDVEEPGITVLEVPPSDTIEYTPIDTFDFNKDDWSVIMGAMIDRAQKLSRRSNQTAAEKSQLATVADTLTKLTLLTHAINAGKRVEVVVIPF